jgi:cephalosporin hydroxylase
VVHAIDSFGGNPGNEAAYRVGGADDLSNLEANFLANIARAGLSHRVVLHAKASAAAAEEVRAQVDRARILCIDAEHTYEAVRLELDQYADLLAPGGLLVFDDYSTSFTGVARAVREHLDDHPGRYARPLQDRNLLVVKRRV